MYPRSQNSATYFLKEKNFVKSVTKQYSNPDSRAFNFNSQFS